MSEDQEHAALRQDERREMASEGGQPDRPTRDTSAFSLRVKPDRRRYVTHIDPECERRQRR